MVPSAAGHPVYSGTFIPELWSGVVIRTFYDVTVLGAIANTDYEGEITKYGDKVHIRTDADIEIHDYEKGQALEVQNPEAPTLELDIDHAHYFNAVLDDVDRHQSDIPLMDRWAMDATQRMKIRVDNNVLGTIPADAGPYNYGATAGRISRDIDLGTTGAPKVLTKANILDFLLNVNLVMDEENVPEEDRWTVLPKWAVAMLKMSDLKDSSMTGDGASTVRTGRVGMVDKLTVYSSNLITWATDTGMKAFNAVAGHKYGLTFATQLIQTGMVQSERTFGNLIRGLLVYGYKVVKPEALVHMYITKG